jgi:hypothetical protein
MADTPAPGKKFMGLSKNQAIIVAIGGAGVVFLVYRHYSAASAAAAASNTAASTADDTGDIDPETGYPYGSAQDTAALAALNESGTGALDDTGAATDSEPYYSTAPTTQSPTTNAAWSQYVQQQLATIGYDPETVAGAIGAYLAQIPLTATQAAIVQVALAECGPPPQGEYSIIPQGSPTPSPTPSGTSYVFPAPTALTATGSGKGKINVTWNPVTGPNSQRPTGYTVAYGRTSGAQTWKNTTSGAAITLTTTPGETEYIEVWANGGPVSPPHAGPVKATAGK